MQALAEMRRQFCAGLDERICRIEAARVTLGTDPVAALDIVAFEAHRICGVAGSIGLPLIGTEARTLETHAIEARARPLSQSDLHAIDSAIDRFLNLLEENLLEN
ncbi:MAG: Hpt domain-containing protein [Roseovarius sp.]